MEKSKLIEYYALLSPKDINGLTRFLQSPYFNDSRILTDLHDYICQSLERNDSSALRKEQCFSLIYPGKPYDDVLMRKSMSRLAILVQRFLSIEQYQNADFAMEGDLLKNLRHRKAERLYNQVYAKVSSKLQKENIKNANYYHRQFSMAMELEKFHSVSSLVSIHALDQNLLDSANLLDRFYIISKLRRFCTVLNYKRVLSSDHKNVLLDEILELTGSPDFAEDDIIVVYKCILMTLIEPEKEDHFKRLVTMLREKQAGLRSRNFGKCMSMPRTTVFGKSIREYQNFIWSFLISIKPSFPIA